MDIDQIAAFLSGCPREKMLVCRLRDDGALVVVIESGQKFVYTPDQIAALAKVSPVLRAADGQFVSPRDQDADGLPELRAEMRSPTRDKRAKRG